MVSILAHNILSPLGTTSATNYAAVKAGCSTLTRYEGKWGLPEPFVASLLRDDVLQDEWDACGVQSAASRPTRFEAMVELSAMRAIKEAGIDVASNRTVLIVSTTKGNVSLLADPDTADSEREYPASAAAQIARAVGFTTPPIVVCNACISGLSAMLLGKRLIESGAYDVAVVTGADAQNAFIVSGFQSFKALSPAPCRPFDRRRDGLNLGEAAATVVLKRTAAGDGLWHLADGAVRNDANHISGPSRTGEGSYRALRYACRGHAVEEFAFVGVHGTATLYNDEMESLALERTGLGRVPVNALKGYYGHTMGAAGIMESILSMCAADDGLILATRGYEEKGVSGNVLINKENTPTTKRAFLKLMSGFGGCNAALRFCRDDETAQNGQMPQNVVRTHCVRLTPHRVRVDGELLPTQATGAALLTAVYRSRIADYPKYYKMDLLSRLGFVASELLLQAEGGERFTPREDRAVILFNRTSSLVADRAHQASIANAESFFPSPSVFVYTLPNIITGEIAIRNKFYGETSLYILPRRDETTIERVLRASFLDRDTRSILTGWIDCPDEGSFEAELFIAERDE